MAIEWKQIAFVENSAAQSVLGNPTGSPAVASAITVAEQTLVGRITGGNVDDLSVEDVKNLLTIIYETQNVVEDLSYLPPATFTWDPGSLGDGVGETSAEQDYPEVVLGDFKIDVVAPYDLQGIVCTAWVSAAGKAKVRLQNETGGTIDLASGTWILQARRI